MSIVARLVLVGELKRSRSSGGIDFVNVANFNNGIHGGVAVLSAMLVASSFSRKVTLTLMSGRKFGVGSLRMIFAWTVFFESDARGRIRDTSPKKTFPDSASRVTSTGCPRRKRASFRRICAAFPWPRPTHHLAQGVQRTPPALFKPALTHRLNAGFCSHSRMNKGSLEAAQHFDGDSY
jgi:hypothetical protein